MPHPSHSSSLVTRKISGEESTEHEAAQYAIFSIPLLLPNHLPERTLSYPRKPPNKCTREVISRSFRCNKRQTVEPHKLSYSADHQTKGNRWKPTKINFRPGTLHKAMGLDFSRATRTGSWTPHRESDFLAVSRFRV
jgi:hypothetical protein